MCCCWYWISAADRDMVDNLVGRVGSLLIDGRTIQTWRKARGQRDISSPVQVPYRSW
jgi:hypothetical protein